jgi:hypothetical protein
MPLPQSVEGFTKVGKFYTCTAPTDANKVQKLARELQMAFVKGEPKKLVWILTGTHGTPQGELVAERKFFWNEDKQLETQYFKAVDVFHFTANTSGQIQISKNSWDRYTGANAIVVLAWCYSEQSRTGWMKKAGLKDI